MRSLLNATKSDKVSVEETKSADCQNPTDGLRTLFVDMVQKKRVEKGQCPARRPVFLRTHGIINGMLNFEKDIPAEMRHGLFAKPGSQHPVLLRYSSDLTDNRPDWLSTIGLGLKIFDVPGEKDEPTTADLLFQNVPFFFVDTAQEMCGFTKASLEGWGDEWIRANSPATSRLLDDLQKSVYSVFQTRLWSVIPFKLGESHHCKYIIKPKYSQFVAKPNTNDPNYLGKDLAERMLAGEACLELYIQLRPTDSNAQNFPLDQATVIWDEEVAPPIKVATIDLQQQDINTEAQRTYGDWLAFNVGRVPETNAPVGSIAEARIEVYKTSADYRRGKNNQPVCEPEKPNAPVITEPDCPFGKHPPKDCGAEQLLPEQPVELSAEQIARIAHLRIHPGIGVSRVGNSRDYYVGPEVMEPKSRDPIEMRDDEGGLKRQAARFRIYAYDKDNQVVGEVQHTASTPVEWAVHVANKKAQWYEFNAAMDVAATRNVKVKRRNAAIKGGNRYQLCIDPGEKRISGLGMHDGSYRMSGEFQGTPVTLGELRTDAMGRLLFLPGHGISASPEHKPVFDPAHPGSFNNASGWYDDIADGPVRASVKLGGRTFEADPAWVISAPPNYAPDLVSWRTMDDLMRTVMIKAGMLDAPRRVSFRNDIQPVLERLNKLQWVNKGFLSLFGAGSPMNFADNEFLRRLSKAPISSQHPDPYQNVRRSVYHYFRAAHGTESERIAYPPLYGDMFGYDDSDPSVSGDIDANQYLRLPDWFERNMRLWVKGDFIDDYDAKAPQDDGELESVVLQQQPEMLDRAAMHFCLADAFHPGCEMTWPMRHASMYRAPYRIRMRSAYVSEPSYPYELSQQDVLRMEGPLYHQGPGDLTRWMALPWQGDTAYCRSGYDMEYDPYLPAYWPARVPNQVLTLEDYETLHDKDLSMDVRIAAFYNRPPWLRQLPSSSAPENMEYLIKHFGEMGILQAKPRPDDIDWLPETVYVEHLTEVKEAEVRVAHALFMKDAENLSESEQLAVQAGWFSAEQRDEFAMIKRRGN